MHTLSVPDTREERNWFTEKEKNKKNPGPSEEPGNRKTSSISLFPCLEPQCPDGHHQPSHNTYLPVRKSQPSPHLSPVSQQGPSLDVPEFEASAERWLLSSASFSLSNLMLPFVRGTLSVCEHRAPIECSAERDCTAARPSVLGCPQGNAQSS